MGKATGAVLSIFFLLTAAVMMWGCARTIRVHPSYYAPSLPEGKIDKKVAVVMPVTERYKRYTYSAWWAGWSAEIELGEALEEITMQTLTSLFTHAYLVRDKPDYQHVDFIFTPTITNYRHDLPALFTRLVPSTASVTIHINFESSHGEALIDADYKGKDSKSQKMDSSWNTMEELAEKVLEQTFEIIASDLIKVLKHEHYSRTASSL